MHFGVSRVSFLHSHTHFFLCKGSVFGFLPCHKLLATSFPSHVLTLVRPATKKNIQRNCKGFKILKVAQWMTMQSNFFSFLYFHPLQKPQEMAFPEATQLFPSVIQHTCPKEKVIPWGNTTHLLKEEHFFEEHNHFFGLIVFLC